VLADAIRKRFTEIAEKYLSAKNKLNADVNSEDSVFEI